MLKKILVVDDQEVTVALLVKRLTKQGYEVVTAHDGQEAQRKVENLHPDLVIMDIMLPDMDGSEIVRSWQKSAPTKSIPVIFLSSIIDNTKSKQFGEVQVGDVLYPAAGKPLDTDQLLNKIFELLGTAVPSPRKRKA